VCFCIHWVVQNTKQHPSLIHAGSVYTCVFFSFSFLYFGKILSIGGSRLGMLPVFLNFQIVSGDTSRIIFPN